jgi:hypothetical protein
MIESSAPVKKMAPQSGNSTFANSSEEEELQLLYENLRSSEWKSRFTAIQGLVSFAQEHPKVFAEQLHVTSCVDVFIDRLQDGNIKVNQLAVNSLCDMIPIMRVRIAKL